MITGDHFSAIPAENRVMFGAVEATVQSASKTSLTVTVPAGAAYAPVSVSKGGLTARYYLPFNPTFSAGTNFTTSHFAPPVAFALAGANYDVEVMDMDRDGRPDVVAEGASNFAYTFRNTHTTGAITTATLQAGPVTAAGAINFRLVDCDEDGYADIPAVNGVLFRNTSSPGAISFSSQVTIGLGASNMDYADVNLDGKTDLVATNGGQAQLLVLENRSRVGSISPPGTFGSFTSFPFPKPSSTGGVVTADFDADGFPDVVAVNPTVDNLSIFRNQGRPKVSATQFHPRVDLATGDNPGRIYSGDMDGDRKVDLVLYHGAGTNPALLIVFHNTSTTGNISFARVDITLPSAATVAHISDLDGDGKPEILVNSETGNRFFILKNNAVPGTLSAASFGAPVFVTVTGPRGLTTGDLNMDGKPEIILTNSQNNLLVYENLVPVAEIVITSQPVGATLCAGGSATFSVEASGTTGITWQWQRFNTTLSVYENLAEGNGYAGVNTKTLAVNTAAGGTQGQYRCRVRGDLAFDVFTAAVTLTVNPKPASPGANTATRCGPGSVTLVASGAAPGQYRWYSAADPLNAISGATNNEFVTPVLNAGTSYQVAINNGTCESDKVTVTAEILVIPAKPQVTVNGSTSFCDTETRILTAPEGFVFYSWSNGAKTRQITVAASGQYAVSVASEGGCESAFSDPVVIQVSDCSSNQPPVITPAEAVTVVGGEVIIDLAALLDDPDNNIDPSTLSIVAFPVSGADAFIRGGNQLVVSYHGVSWSGKDVLRIRVCDVAGSCAEQEMTISVVGDIVVYNAVSANGDGVNDFFFIEYIEIFEDTKSNKVGIFNRWGSPVFTVDDYDNEERVFTGINKNGDALPSGVYYYKIEFSSGRASRTGYLYLQQ